MGWQSVPGSWGSAVKNVLKGNGIGFNRIEQSTLRGVSAPGSSEVDKHLNT